MHNKLSVIWQALPRQLPVVWQFKVVVPGRRFGKPWYNHLYVEIFAIHKGGCTQLIIKNESSSRVIKFQTWSHGGPCFSLNFRHEKLDNKLYRVVCILFGIANKNYVGKK